MHLVLAGALCSQVLNAAPDWDNLPVSVRPGQGVYSLKIGQPLPEDWPEELGKPTRILPYHDTGEGYRRITWGKIEAGQLKKGITLLAVGFDQDCQILELHLRRIRASVVGTEVFLGLPVDRLKTRASKAQRDGVSTYVLPGLHLEVEQAKITGLRIAPMSGNTWRFEEWTVRPGREVGPLALGVPPDKSLYEELGPPSATESGRLVWSSPERNQLLELTLDPKTRSVTRIRSSGLAWKTDRGVTLGATSKTFLEKHPGSRAGLGLEIDETVVRLPGLRATFHHDRLTGFDIYPIPKQP